MARRTAVKRLSGSRQQRSGGLGARMAAAQGDKALARQVLQAATPRCAHWRNCVRCPAACAYRKAAFDG